LPWRRFIKLFVLQHFESASTVKYPPKIFNFTICFYILRKNCNKLLQFCICILPA